MSSSNDPMDFSPQQHNVCLSAAVADLTQSGMTFPEFVPDCGSYDCAHCTTIRQTSSKVESVTRKQARLTHFETPQAMTNSAFIGKDDDTPSVLSGAESSFSTARQPAEKTLEELCGLESFEERESIEEFMCNATDKEQPELMSGNDNPCGFEDEDYEIVDLDEAQIDEARVLQMSTGKGKAVVVRRWFARSSSD